MTFAALNVTLKGTPEEIRGVLGYCAGTGVLASPTTQVGYEPDLYVDTVTGGDLVRLVQMMCAKDGLGQYETLPKGDYEKLMSQFPELGLTE